MDNPYCRSAPGHPFHGPYHDTEYGVPLRGDAELFERLVLEINQAGLSWLTILKKRDGFRRAYGGFDPAVVAAYGDADRARLLADPGIIRNRLKVEASVLNARAFLAVQAEYGSFDRYIWQFVGNRPIQTNLRRPDQIVASTPESDAMSKDLKQRGFKFVGTTICYAYMQATGMTNDHLVSCPRHKACAKLG